MYKIKFKYADSMSNWEWRTQGCQLSALNEQDAIRKCKEIYGLGIDCEYEIISIELV
jgi:hypothetical protein